MNETFHSLKVYLRQIFQVNISVSDEFDVANALLHVVRYFWSIAANVGDLLIYG